VHSSLIAMLPNNSDYSLERTAVVFGCYHSVGLLPSVQRNTPPPPPHSRGGGGGGCVGVTFSLHLGSLVRVAPANFVSVSTQKVIEKRG
jgi:hypothetical protein